MTKPNPFKISQMQLDRCAKTLHLDQNIHEILRVPMREIHVSLPVRMDDGTMRIFQGFRIGFQITQKTKPFSYFIDHRRRSPNRDRI